MRDQKIKMKTRTLISAVGFCLAIGSAWAIDLSKDAEVAAFQKLEQLATKQMQTGVTSQEPLLKAHILEARALFANGELGRDQWLAKEKKLNVELLQIQSHRVSQGQDSIEKVFAFQNTLLSTRELLRRNSEAENSQKDKSIPGKKQEP